MTGFQKSGDQPCFYCGKLAASYDHIKARSRGGSHASSNLVPACLSCNSSKRQLSLEEFRLHIQLTEGRYPVVFYGEIGEPVARDFLFVASPRKRGALIRHNVAAR